MAKTFHAFVQDKVKYSARSFTIVADTYHDAYGLARGACKTGEELTSLEQHSEDVIICPQVAKEAAKHS